MPSDNETETKREAAIKRTVDKIRHRAAMYITEFENKRDKEIERCDKFKSEVDGLCGRVSVLADEDSMQWMFPMLDMYYRDFKDREFEHVSKKSKTDE